MSKEHAPASETTRRIPKSKMKDIANFLPRDGFVLTPEMLGKTFVIVDVVPTDFNGIPSFIAIGKCEDMTIHLSAALWKRMRVAGKDALKIEVADLFESKDRITVRGTESAEAIWSASQYLHEAMKMTTESDFIVPETVTLEFAILAKDANQDGNKPAMNPFFYEGFSDVVNHYRKEDKFPTLADFEEEIKKTGEDRIPALKASITGLVPLKRVELDNPTFYRYNLVVKDVKKDNE